MIILLHGDNTTASRQELMRRVEEAKKSGKEIRKLDGNATDAPGLTQAIQSASLFGGSVFVVIEGLLAKFGKKEKQAGELTDIIKKSVDSADIILLEGKLIGKTLTGLLGEKSEVQIFQTPVVIFKFLDAIGPGRSASSISLLREALALDHSELIFSLLVRRVRQLNMLRDGVTPDGLQGWQAGRLTTQAKSFTMDRLLAMEKRLLAIDISIKDGSSPFSLVQQLELFFVDL